MDRQPGYRQPMIRPELQSGHCLPDLLCETTVVVELASSDSDEFLPIFVAMHAQTHIVFLAALGPSDMVMPRALADIVSALGAVIDSPRASTNYFHLFPPE